MDTIITKNVGRIYLFLPFIKRLKIGEIVEKYLQDGGDIEIGKVTEILILNRACGANTPLYKISQWAKEHGIDTLYGIDTKKLTDDRVGAVLDKIYDYQQTLDAEISIDMVKEFDLDISQIHFDPSSFAVTGKMLPPAGEKKTIKANYGRGPEGNYRKQVHFSLAVTGQGTIPLCGQAYDGSTCDTEMHPDALQELRTIAQNAAFLFVSDSKFDTHDNLKNVFQSADFCPFFGKSQVRKTDAREVPGQDKSGVGSDQV